MLYEVITASGSSIITEASSSREAKSNICKKLQIRPSDYWHGVPSMKAHRVYVDYPEAHYRALNCPEVLEQFSGKDIILYDEHHGTAARIRKATPGVISYYMNEYTTIIEL